MAFPHRPTESISQIRKASKILVKGKGDIKKLLAALDLLNRFRACHSYPINTFRATLTRKLRLYEKPLVAQRLKRMPTILDKLERHPAMQITKMQDIGGLRAIVKTVSDVRKLTEEYKSSHFEHELLWIDNYIDDPKEDGYRSIHLIYRYHSNNKKGAEYSGLLLELQIRSKLQHIWSTSVETMGTLIGQSLKTRKGEKKWIEFFALTSSAFAHREKTALVPAYAHMTLEETVKALSDLEKELGVMDKMRGFTVAAKEIDTQGKGSYYHLIILNSLEQTVSVRSFPRDSLKQATAALAKYEARAAAGEKIDPVLVAAGSLENLKRAYPNYFLDTREFMGIISQLSSGSRKAA